MTEDQTQVNPISSSALVDDPGKKLVELQNDVDLIKGSIQKLLIDIRERMNELDNPILNKLHNSNMIIDASSTMDPGIKAIQATSTSHRVNENDEELTSEFSIGGANKGFSDGRVSLDAGGEISKSSPEYLESLSALQSEITSMQPNGDTEINSKVRLQKVFGLFEWTNKNIKKFGHDRLLIVLETYREMGYISNKSCKLIEEIAQLIPPTSDESHEIKADEFVSELYELNHILDPVDSTMDRDMIEVLMEQRQKSAGEKKFGSLVLPEDDV